MNTYLSTTIMGRLAALEQVISTRTIQWSLTGQQESFDLKTELPLARTPAD